MDKEPAPPRDSSRSLRFGGLSAWLAFLAVAAPVTVAIWAVPRFLTQDGSAHIYSAHVINESFGENSPFRSVYVVKAQPLPNWAGHAFLVALLRLVSPEVADKIAATITLVGFAASVFFLRLQVVGDENAIEGACYSILIAMNCVWLFGFTSFLLGAIVSQITLAWWWSRRDALGRGAAAGLGLLTVLGYFCHLVSLGLTTASLVWLAWMSPREVRKRRLAWTALGLLPVIPLAFLYLGLTRSSSEPMRPAWETLRDPFSLRGWFAQLAWVEPISLASKFALPLADPPRYAVWYVLLTPALWVLIHLLCVLPATIRACLEDGGRRAWRALGAILVLAGIVCPDGFGKSHGWFLPQRVVLLGLAALAPAIAFGGASRFAKAGRFALWAAWAFQTMFVWDYAIDGSRKAERFLAARSLIGENQKVASVLIGIDGRFRANPLLHLDCLFGVGTGNVVWSDYETSHYYFPVRPIDPERLPNSRDFDRLFMLQAPEEVEERANLWISLLDRFADQIDVAFVWGSDPLVEAANAARFERVERFASGSVWSGRRVVNSPASR